MSAILKRSLIVAMPCAALLFNCAQDDQMLAPFQQALTVEIIGGPAQGATILNNAHFTFEWRARGGHSEVGYEVQLSGVDTQPIATTENSKSYPGLTAGSYTFSVSAKAAGETATASRTFNVGANSGAPVVVISGPRGSASAGGSGIVPAYVPGAVAVLQWSASDPDRFGKIVGFRWRSTDAGSFNDFALASTAGFEVPGATGTYTFTLEAKDNAGDVSATSFAYEVRAPAVLLVDDKPQANPVTELEEDAFYAALFEGFAFVQWDVARQGQPGTADFAGFQVAVIYSGGGSALWRGLGTNYPEMSAPLADFLGAGGKLWAMGQEILEDLAPTSSHSNPPAADEFEAVFLHLAPASGDSATDAGRVWARAGAASGDGKFSFADNVLSDVTNYPRIAIDVQSGDVDRIIPGDGAEVIYGGTDGLGNGIGNVSIRFPASETNTQTVFQTFPLFENSTVKASSIDSKTLTQSIMKGLGQ